MSGETVWFSRRKKQGQKSNQWKVDEPINRTFQFLFQTKEEVKDENRNDKKN